MFHFPNFRNENNRLNTYHYRRYDSLSGDRNTEASSGSYPCIDDEVLNYIIEGKYKGIGFDVIGLDPIDDENLTRHKKLFETCDIVNIENLKNLHLCKNDLVNFSCCPLKLKNSDGAPVRAVAWW